MTQSPPDASERVWKLLAWHFALDISDPGAKEKWHLWVAGGIVTGRKWLHTLK